MHKKEGIGMCWNHPNNLCTVLRILVRPKGSGRSSMASHCLSKDGPVVSVLRRAFSGQIRRRLGVSLLSRRRLELKQDTQQHNDASVDGL